MRLLVLANTVLIAAAAKKEAEPEPNIMAQVQDALVAPCVDLAKTGVDVALEIVSYVVASPRWLADRTIEFVDVLRSMPDLMTNVWKGDAKTQDDLHAFVTSVCTMAFTVYAATAALNLLIMVVCAVKNYLSKQGVLDIPKKVSIPVVNKSIDLPKPVLDVIAIVQKNLLDKIKSFRTDVVFPLSGESGGASVKAMVSSTSAALSLCMLLSCSGEALALMRNGANKGAAEALAWTAGTALGIQYLVNRV